MGQDKEWSDKKKRLVIEVKKIIADNLGDHIAESYSKFYADRSVKDIIASCGELLEELLGPKNAKAHMDYIHEAIEGEKV